MSVLVVVLRAMVRAIPLSHLRLPIDRPRQAPICHRWRRVIGIDGCPVILKTSCVLSTEHMRLRFRPRLRAVPVLATAAVSPAMADVLATPAAVSPAVADCGLAPKSATRANLANMSAFVFVCAPPTPQAIGGRHCS